MSHQIIEDLTSRYTTKKYDRNRRIPPQDIAIIKEAIRLSASSINSQPWRFILIESEAGKARLDATFKINISQINTTPPMPRISFCSHTTLYTKKRTTKKYSISM